MEIDLRVNGELHRIEVDPDESLLDTLRDRLGLTGAKKGCGTGDCGACTVILGGRAVPGCLVLSAVATGKEITTIEGLAAGDALHPVQRTFVDLGGVQCGYCTPGFIMAAVALLEGNPRPTDEEMRAGLSNNLCRCTGYAQIFDAVRSAGLLLEGGER